jgi:secretion/DNA translocation related TadE-like protein
MTLPRAQQGSITVVMLAVVVFGLVLAAAGGRVGRAVIGRARADTAADAAALAAADRLALGAGSSEAEDAARATATSNGAVLDACTCSGSEAEVVVTVDLGILGTATGHARAVVDLVCGIDPRSCR